MVDDYLDSFLTLVSDTRYTDPRTLVVKFRRDLKSNIQSQIATMPVRRPADADLCKGTTLVLLRLPGRVCII